jgi:hypothetical protein
MIELTNGLLWEAHLLPVSSQVVISDGLYSQSFVETTGSTIALIASYGGDTSEIT